MIVPTPQRLATFEVNRTGMDDSDLRLAAFLDSQALQPWRMGYLGIRSDH